MTTEIEAPAPPGDAPPGAAVESPDQIVHDRQMIVEARKKGTGSLLWVFTKLSGPGWLQGAITLGGGSLGGSLYLGVLAGFGMLWWQPMVMVLGVIMLSAIAYVTLATGQRPFQAINRHVNPVLGWAWAIATLMANMVWCMPQFSLGAAALKQNLAPGFFGGIEDGRMSTLVAVAILFIAAGIVVWFYESGGTGIRIFEWILKAMVAVVVISFFGVVIKMTTSDALAWSEIFDGFIPRFDRLWNPSPEFDGLLAAAGGSGDFWRQQIVSTQQGVMITAAATAVGINMTFLMPYSMLARGWDREFRGLASFDLATGLFIPYLLATSCVVIAAAAQFHGVDKPAHEALVQLYEDPDAAGKVDARLVGSYQSLLDTRLKDGLGADAFGELDDAALNERRAALPEADRRIAAMIVKRDASDLAGSLETLVGKGTAQIVFGIGVLGMAVSTIIILMLINGFVICEMLGLEPKGTAHRIGCYLAGISGAMGPFIWGGDKAQFWLVVPTSMFGMALLPIAYFTFLFMMNSPALMGANMPQGGKRIAWNLAMGLAAGVATILCLWAIGLSKTPLVGYGVLAGFILLALIVHFARGARTSTTP
jgi:Mn2+/Fe2+ NRAMP family transporter